MVNINFHQTNQASDSQLRKKRVLNTGFVVSVIILSVSFLTFFGMKIYHEIIESKITVTKNQIDGEVGSIEKNKMSRVVDFQRRLEGIDANISEGKNPTEILSEIEGLMVSGAMLTSYEYDSLTKSLILEAVADNFQTVSRQASGLKNSDCFENVRMPEAAIGEDGKVGFTLESQLTFLENK